MNRTTSASGLARVRSAAEVSASASPLASPVALDPATVAVLADLMRAARGLAVASAPVVVHAAPSPAVTAHQAHPGVDVRLSGPAAPTALERPRRRLYTRPEAACIASAASTVAGALAYVSTGDGAAGAVSLAAAVGVLLSAVGIVRDESPRGRS